MYLHKIRIETKGLFAWLDRPGTLLHRHQPLPLCLRYLYHRYQHRRFAHTFVISDVIQLWSIIFVFWLFIFGLGSSWRGFVSSSLELRHHCKTRIFGISLCFIVIVCANIVVGLELC